MNCDELRRILKPRARQRLTYPKDHLLAHKSIKAFPKRFSRAYQRIERAILHALIAKGASERSNELAAKVASCSPNQPCGETTVCWWCKVRGSLSEAEAVTAFFADADCTDISAVTVILPTIFADDTRTVRQRIRSFRKDWAALCRSWPNCRWWGRVELDLLTGHPKQVLGAYVRQTLKALGHSHSEDGSHVAAHAHILLAHPGHARASVRGRLSILYRAPRQVEVKSLHDMQHKEEALSRYTSYMLKVRPPSFALAGRGSRTCRPRYPAIVREYIRLQRRFDDNELLIKGILPTSRLRPQPYLITPRSTPDSYYDI